jgi:hypothetical protein
MLIQNTELLSQILGNSFQQLSGRDLFTNESSQSQRLYKTLRLAEGDGLALPSAIIASQAEAEDLFATTAAYYQDQSPLSAVTHVIAADVAKLFDGQGHVSKKSRQIDNRYSRLACLGAAAGEAVLTSLGSAEMGGILSYAACRRSLSFSLCRARLLYGRRIHAQDIADRWARLRILTGLAVSAEVLATSLHVHSLAFHANDFPSALPLDDETSRAIQLMTEGHEAAGEFLLSALADAHPSTTRHLDALRGAFDGRMTAFMEIARILQEDSRNVLPGEIFVAFVCNQILPGSFAHTSVLSSLASQFPAALIWYGFFSALSGFDVRGKRESGLTVKLERDVLEPFSIEQRPRCDISLDELEVLSRIQLRVDMIRPSQQRSLLVALFPGVDVYSRFGGEADLSNGRARRDSALREANSHLSRLLEEALFILKRTGGLDSEAPNRRLRKDR